MPLGSNQRNVQNLASELLQHMDENYVSQATCPESFNNASEVERKRNVRIRNAEMKVTNL